MKNKLKVEFTPSRNEQGKVIGAGNIILPIDVPGVIIATALIVRGVTRAAPEISKKVDKQFKRSFNDSNSVDNEDLEFRELKNISNIKNNPLSIKLV